ncbi:MAG: hypothetical protein ABI596_02380 [Pyrinomonadaceae bacterium]
MTSEAWQQLDKLFQSAMEREPEERADFLAEARAVVVRAGSSCFVARLFRPGLLPRQDTSPQ